MAVEQDHVQANPQVPLRAKKHTRTVTGSLVASSGVITGLPSKHKITAGDRIDISVTGTPPVALENGVIAASDMSGYLGGAPGNVAYLRIDQAQSLFDFPGTYPDQATARAAMEAVFTLGRTIYFDSGIFAGASINVGELAVVPGQTVHDDTTSGLLTGYWYLIVNLSTGVGFPSLAAFASETSVSPAVSVNDSAGGNITASGLIVTAAGANSVTIPTGLPDIASFPDLTVHEHSEVADVLVTQELETASLKVNGESVIAPVSKILYSGNINNLKVIWSGYDDTNAQISGDVPHKTEITPTDVFNVGVDINLIQIMTHPTDNTVGVMLYQDIATSKIYLKSFRYTYESGFTNTFTPFEIVGADSIDIRAGFVTAVNYLTKAIVNAQLVVFGGKATPGTSVYAGAYTINLTTLDVVETYTWADTTLVIGTGTFTSLDRVIDAEYMSGSTTLRMGVTFGSGQFAYFEDLFTFIWDSTSSHIFYHSDIVLGQGSTRILVVNKEEIGSVGSGGDETFRSIASNIHARFRRLYTGTNAGTVMLLKVDAYKGIGSETIGITDFNNDVTVAPRGAAYFDVIPGNIQNGSTRLENLTFDLGNDKILTYKSSGYYVISDRETGQMVYLGKDGSSHLTKADRVTAMMINGDTVLYYKSGAWKAQKFMPEGPFLAYTTNAGYAITAPPGVKVEVPYALDPGKTYFWGWDDQLVGMSPSVGTKPLLAARRLGIAVTSSFFISEFTHKSNPSYSPYVLTYATQAEAEAATSATGVMSPLLTRQLLDAAFDIPKWVKLTIPYSYFITLLPLATNQGVYNLSFGSNTKVVIHQVVQKHSTAFAGTGITGVAVSMGYGLAPLDMQYYSDPLDVYQAVADTAYNNTVSNAVTDMVGTTNAPRLFIETTGGLISDLNAGSVDIWVKYSVLP